MVSTTSSLVSLEDFIRRYDAQPFEWLAEEEILVSPTVAGQNMIFKRLMKILLAYENEHGGAAFSETTFVLTHDSAWVKGSRQPDVMYFVAARLQQYRENHADWASKPFVIVPDLAVEVVSKNDSYSDINRKVDVYFEDGVRLVWVIDPQHQTVTVHTSESLITLDDTLSGGDMMPDLSISLTALI